MAGTSLLALIDDIATLLDDIAVFSKVAAKNTVGVLGDDLALNAEQVAGVRAERELPVVWAVAKGSFVNKLILVPVALLISLVAPVVITVLLMAGGAYLCFEGFEKLVHKFTAGRNGESQEHLHKIQQMADPDFDLVAFEQSKINGAIRTDFILSAEIIVIAMGSVSDASFAMQAAVVAGLALAITAGVYGLVAGIVKLDDAGLYLLRQGRGWQCLLGRGLLNFAPLLMKTLSVLGTAAMFLVGGGILLHGLPFAHGWLDAVAEQLHNWPWLLDISNALVAGLLGVVAGAIVLVVVMLVGRWVKK